MQNSPTSVWKVVTTPEGGNRNNTSELLPQTLLRTRPVATVILSDSSPAPDSPANPPVTDVSTKEQQVSTGEGSLVLNVLPADDDSNSNQTGVGSPLDSTPLSVITNPDTTELETANVLLQLGNTGNLEEQNQLDTEYDNSNILPVDSAPLKDFARDMREKEKEKESNDANNDKNTKNKDKDHEHDTDSDTDSDKTVDYMCHGIKISLCRMTLVHPYLVARATGPSYSP